MGQAPEENDVASGAGRFARSGLEAARLETPRLETAHAENEAAYAGSAQTARSIALHPV
jgi:hypothetical protein